MRLNVFLMISGQYCASNANLTAWLPLATGGSWKKSPVTTSCEACSVRADDGVFAGSLRSYLDAPKWKGVFANLGPDLS